MPRRSHQESPWHFCQRCDKKTHLSDMHRERGLIICNRISCQEESLIGERDGRIAKAVSSAAISDELKPHPLISEPQQPGDEDIFF